MPSAAFVEAVHAIADIELTPGLASASSCPEAIWQSARWWGDYYRESARVAAAGMTRSAGHAQPQVPAGAYAVRQHAAAVDHRARRGSGADVEREEETSMTGEVGGRVTETAPAGHYDVIVVGSGFGGSVMTYRLREAGLNVCLLERGKAYPPGSFPRSPYAFRRAFWDPSEGLYGMYNAWWFDHIGAVVSSGLGGGSLIYANVMLRKDPAWFVHEDLEAGGTESWPIGRDDLEPHYDRAERMLNAQPFPFTYPPYDTTPRTVAFHGAARQLGWEPFTPNLAVTFRNEGDDPVPGEPIREAHPNLHGRTRTTCRLCGECDIGCNFGSKNTLDYNYLSEAARLGAEIHTLTEVRAFAPRDGGGWTVDLVRHDPAREGDEARHGPPADDADQRRPARPVRGDARIDLPDVPQPAAPAADARHALFRQRRPADARPAPDHQGRRQDGADPDRPRARAGHHQRDPLRRRDRRRRRPRVLRPGHRLPRVRRLDAPGDRRARDSCPASATPPSACCARRSTGCPRRTCRRRSRT